MCRLVQGLTAQMPVSLSPELAKYAWILVISYFVSIAKAVESIYKNTGTGSNRSQAVRRPMRGVAL
jgi:hypothetical protein